MQMIEPFFVVSCDGTNRLFRWLPESLVPYYSVSLGGLTTRPM